jgi:hypothetical protein
MLEAAVTTCNRNALLSAPGSLYLFADDRFPAVRFSDPQAGKLSHLPIDDLPVRKLRATLPLGGE